MTHTSVLAMVFGLLAVGPDELDALIAPATRTSEAASAVSFLSYLASQIPGCNFLEAAKLTQPYRDPTWDEVLTEILRRDEDRIHEKKQFREYIKDNLINDYNTLNGVDSDEESKNVSEALKAKAEKAQEEWLQANIDAASKAAVDAAVKKLNLSALNDSSSIRIYNHSKWVTWNPDLAYEGIDIPEHTNPWAMGEHVNLTYEMDMANIGFKADKEKLYDMAYQRAFQAAITGGLTEAQAHTGAVAAVQAVNRYDPNLEASHQQGFKDMTNHFVGDVMKDFFADIVAGYQATTDGGTRQDVFGPELSQTEVFDRFSGLANHIRDEDSRYRTNDFSVTAPEVMATY